MFFKKLLTANVDENKLLLSKQTNATQLEFCASQLIMYCTTKTSARLLVQSKCVEFWVEIFAKEINPKIYHWKEGSKKFPTVILTLA